MSAATRPTGTPGLRAQAEAAAASTYKHRCAELEALAPLLRQLDEFMPALRALGLDLSPSDLSLGHEHLNNRRMRVLRARTGGVFDDVRRICGWLEALKALGFAELSRTGTHYPTALLRRGTLLMRVDVLRTPPAAATEPPPHHSTSVRQAIAEAQSEQVPA